MEESKEKVFMTLLFERMEEALKKLHAVRHEKQRAEVECINLQEEIKFLEQKKAYYEAKKLLDEVDDGIDKIDSGEVWKGA